MGAEIKMKGFQENDHVQGRPHGLAIPAKKHGALSNLCGVGSLNRPAKPLFPANIATLRHSDSSLGWLDLSRGDLN